MDSDSSLPLPTGAGFRTDLEIRSLDRTDICELFSGKKNLKLRKDIIEVIHPKVGQHAKGERVKRGVFQP